MLEGTSSSSRFMTGANRPQRFNLSLQFLNRKKKRKNFVVNEVLSTSIPVKESTLFSETRIGDLLQDIVEENEEQLLYNGRALAGGIADKKASRNDDLRAGSDHENLSLALVPNYSNLLEFHKDSSSVQGSLSYKSFDIAYPPGESPPSRRRTERSSSMKAFDASTRSDSLRTESAFTQISIASRKAWLSSRCGFRSCTKQIDMESQLRSKDKAAHGEVQKSHHSWTRASDPNVWDRDAVSGWNALAKLENDAVRRTLCTRKRKGYQKSNKLAPSPVIFPSEGVLTPDLKSMIGDPYEEVREAAKYNVPSQYADALVGNSGPGLKFHSLTDGDLSTGEEEYHRCERSFSSSCTDDELFTTSLEQDGKSRRKEWSPNSSDESDVTHRSATARGSHTKSKSTWSNHKVRGDVVQEGGIDGSQKAGGKKGSRIIFLSTPPRPTELEIGDDEPASKQQLLLKTSSDRFGEYSRLEVADEARPHLERTYSLGYRSSLRAGSLEVDMEATAKALSKLDVGANIGGELPMVSRLREPGQNRLHQIDVRIDDQLVNLPIESDLSDSSRRNGCTSLPGSSRLISKALSKSLDQEILFRKKKGANSRRRGRKTRTAPPLPSDLHGKVKESVAVVKSSYNPYSDFRASMVEMIVEKEIQGATDLEELLRCYLSLNSAEYHSVIVKVFADVWRELFADAM